VIDGLQVNNLGAFSNASGDPNKVLYVQMIHDRLGAMREVGIPLHVVDARDYHALSRTLEDIKPQVIVQLAAIAHANRSNKDPFSTFDHSFRTLENALDAARGREMHFVYFSSSMVYGNFNCDAVTEDRHCEPLGIYGGIEVWRREAGHRVQSGIRVCLTRSFGLPRCTASGA